ncbi:hypothetical protein, partial [Pseudomonas sp.]|uniref:hypothetical protein n=1 Tax=Pseudomonas sp. TaxID=306 RepID=UPI0031DB721B
MNVLGTIKTNACELFAFGFSLLAFGFWLLAFGFWLLAFGFWLLKVGFQIRFTYSRHGGAESPFRLYGDLLFDWAKSRQKPPLPSSGPYAPL